MYHAHTNMNQQNRPNIPNMGFSMNSFNRQNAPLIIGGLVLAYTALHTANPREMKKLTQSDGYGLLAPILVGYAGARAMIGGGF